MGPEDKLGPCQCDSYNASQYPFCVEWSIVSVRYILGIIVVRAVFTAVAILCAVVSVLIPALLVHGMAALHHYLIVYLKRFFAQIAGLCHDVGTDSHVVARIADDVFAIEKLVTNKGHQILQYHPDDECNDGCNEDS